MLIELTECLPDENYVLLSSLMLLLYRIIQHKEQNKVHMRQLSTLFGSSLLNLPNSNPMRNVMDAADTNKVCEIMIQNAPKLFNRHRRKSVMPQTPKILDNVALKAITQLHEEALQKKIKNAYISSYQKPNAIHEQKRAQLIVSWLDSEKQYVDQLQQILDASKKVIKPGEKHASLLQELELIKLVNQDLLEELIRIYKSLSSMSINLYLHSSRTW